MSYNAEINFTINASNQATPALESVGKSFGDLEKNAASATVTMGKTSVSMSDVGRNTQTATMSTKDLVLGFSGLATSGMALYGSIDNVMDAQVNLHRTQLMVKSSAESVDKAQTSYNNAVKKFGPDSAQAKQAADNLAVAQDRNALAVERAEMVQGNYNEMLVSTAISIIPQVITIVGSLGKLFTGMGLSAAQSAVGVAATGAAGTAAGTGMSFAATGAKLLNGALNLMKGHPIILALSLITAALIALWELCPPFRQAVEAIAKVLGDALGVAVEAVRAGLEWLWKNILEPIANFLSAVFSAAWNQVVAAFQELMKWLQPVADAFGWLWGQIETGLKWFGDQMNKAAEVTEAMALSSENGLSVMENVYATHWENMTKKVDEETQKQLDEVNKTYEEMMTKENERYQEDLANYTAYWENKYKETETPLSKVTQIINEHYDKLIEDVKAKYEKMAEDAQASYDKQIDDWNNYWNTKLGNTETPLDQINELINSHYDEEISKAREHYETLRNEAQTAYDTQVNAYLEYWNSRYNTAETELDKATAIITKHYDDELREVQTGYNNQVQETEMFYDSMRAVTNAGLMALREERSAHMDAMEMAMLQEKVALNNAYQQGLIDQETYETQKSELSKRYNEERSIASDTYRLQELQMEKSTGEELVRIDGEEKTALEGLATTHKNAVTGIETEKNGALIEAENQYNSQIVPAKEQLNATLEQIKDDEKKKITELENQKNADLTQAATEFANVIKPAMDALATALAGFKEREKKEITDLENQKNADLDEAGKRLEAIELDHATKIKDMLYDQSTKQTEILLKAHEQRKEDADRLCKEINSNTKLSEDEKKRLITDINADIVTDSYNTYVSITQNWANTAIQVRRSVDDIVNDLTRIGASVATAQQAAGNIASIEEMARQPSNNPNQAELAQLYKQSEVFKASVQTGQYTKAQIQSGLDATNQRIRELGGSPQYLAEGGIVTRPLVIGEAGAEAVTPLTEVRSWFTSLRDLYFSLNKDLEAGLADRNKLMVEVKLPEEEEPRQLAELQRLIIQSEERTAVLLRSQKRSTMGENLPQHITINPTINIYGNVGTVEEASNLIQEINAGISEGLRRKIY